MNERRIHSLSDDSAMVATNTGLSEIACGFEPPATVYISSPGTPRPISNQLRFYVARPLFSASGPLEALQIFFKWGSDQGALSTLEEASDIGLSNGPEGPPWTITSFEMDRYGLYWGLTAPQDSPAAGESTSFIFDGIVTSAAAGVTFLDLKVFPTTGDPFSLNIPIFKKYPPLQIRTFAASPQSAVKKGQSVTFSWQTWGAEYCHLIGNGQNLRVDPSGSHQLTPDPSLGALYNLVAYDSAGKASQPWPVLIEFET